MSTNAIAFLLLNKYRRGVSTAVLSKEIQALVDEMLKMGYDVSITGEMTEVVNHGVNGDLLMQQKSKNLALITSYVHFV